MNFAQHKFREIKADVKREASIFFDGEIEVLRKENASLLDAIRELEKDSDKRMFDETKRIKRLIREHDAEARQKDDKICDLEALVQ